METVSVKHYFARCRACLWKGDWLAPVSRQQEVDRHVLIDHTDISGKQHPEVLVWEEKHYG